MPFLDVLTILAATIMIGIELEVSLFVNPAIWKLNAEPLAAEIAKKLGKIMPFWYGTCLLLLAIEAVLRRHEPGRAALFAAAAIWLMTIVYTIAFLVPINNRIAQQDKLPGFDWKLQLKNGTTFTAGESFSF